MDQAEVKQRPLTLAGFLLLGVGGLVLLVYPFVRPAVPWQWRLTAESDLESAVVNARLISIDDRGALLEAQGERPVSIITPPLVLPADSGPVLTVTACRPGRALHSPQPSEVRLLWQTEPVAAYHFESQTVLLGARPAEIRFSLPAPPERLHRLGIQFPDISGSVAVSSIALPKLSPIERLTAAWREITAHEPIANHTINFVRGPRVLGHAFNYYLVCGVLAAVGVYGFVQVIGRQRRPSPKVMLGIPLIVWLLADVQATHNLARQAGAEIAELRGKSWPEQIASINGREIAWAYRQLLENAPEGSTFAVVSDDSFTPSHRLAYLLAPRRTWRESYETADFIAVVGAAQAVLDGEARLFKWKQGPWIAAAPVAVASPRLYVVRRLSP